MINMDLLRQMQKVAVVREHMVDSKLAKLVVAQRQIREQIAEQTMDRVRDEILDALIEDTAGLLNALAVNKNVSVVSMPTDASKYFFLYIYFIGKYHKLKL